MVVVQKATIHSKKGDYLKHGISDEMIRRVTITLDPSLESKITNLQARKITESNKAISFSNMINEVLKQGLKDFI